MEDITAAILTMNNGEYSIVILRGQFLTILVQIFHIQ